MKINIEINDDIWARFKDKVKAQGKTLTEVTPTVVEPALQSYINGVETEQMMNSIISEELPIVDRLPDPSKTVHIPAPAPRRCELCDKPTERLHPLNGQKVCYECWKGAQAA